MIDGSTVAWGNSGSMALRLKTVDGDAVAVDNPAFKDLRRWAKPSESAEHLAWSRTFVEAMRVHGAGKVPGFA